MILAQLHVVVANLLDTRLRLAPLNLVLVRVFGVLVVQAIGIAVDSDREDVFGWGSGLLYRALNRGVCCATYGCSRRPGRLRVPRKGCCGTAC